MSQSCHGQLKGEGMTDWKQFLTKQIFKESSFTNTVTISCKESSFTNTVTISCDGGEEMICPNCGCTANYVVNGDKFCANCLSLLMPYPKTSISDLEKIEPMKIALGSFIGDTFGQETRLAEKLNQVIENQNKIIGYLNQQVKR